jgi:hypothetical protein
MSDYLTGEAMYENGKLVELSIFCLDEPSDDMKEAGCLYDTYGEYPEVVIEWLKRGHSLVAEFSRENRIPVEIVTVDGVETLEVVQQGQPSEFDSLRKLPSPNGPHDDIENRAEFYTCDGGEPILGKRMNSPYPAEWDDFTSTIYMRMAWLSSVVNFSKHRQLILPILGIDAALEKWLPTVCRPINGDTLFGAMLFSRAHLVSRTATQLVLAGQQLEAHAIMRASLECAVYGWATIHAKEVREAWMDRLTIPLSKDSAKRMFGWSRLMKRLSAVDVDLASRIRQLYEIFIDYGGHPNAEAVGGGVQKILHPDGTASVGTAYLKHEPETLTQNVMVLAHMLHCNFLLARLAFPDKFAEDSVEAELVKAFQLAGVTKPDELPE